MRAEFVHLHVHSPFSFLDGASRIRDLVERAAELEMPALALTDHNNVSGAVEFQRRAQAAGIKPIQGAELTIGSGLPECQTHILEVTPRPEQSGAAASGAIEQWTHNPLLPGHNFHLTVLAENAAGYANLCRILTDAHLSNERLQPKATWETVAKHSEGLFCLSGCRRGEIPSLILRGRLAEAEQVARRALDIFGPDRFFLELQTNRLPGDRALNRALRDLGDHLGIGLVATGNVHYATRDRFPLHDLLTCIRTLTRLPDVHPERRLNAENDLKPAADIVRACRDYPEAWRNTLRIAEQCEPVLDLSARLFPEFPLPPGQTAERMLRELVFRGAHERYGHVTDDVRARLEHELNVICELGFASYFLLVWDVVRWARQNGIRCAGRGSAADSAVAYCLFITEVDAFSRELMFERFMSVERAERPDIDIDFDARHRDRVAAYVYEKYGADHVASVCTYSTYQGRSAVRDFGKAMGLPEDEIDRLAKRLPWCRADGIREAMAFFPELRKIGIPAAKLDQLLDFCAAAAGFPRHIGTHLGGLVISRDPLVHVTPLQEAAKGVVVCQFDKEYVEDLGLVKLDLLSLRTFSAVEETVRMLNRRRPGSFDYDRIPDDDRATYARLNRGETLGVFQLESPAQRALQSRLGADNIEDIVASVAIIRPGPIKGNMVEPFIARRQGKEPVTYLHPKLEPILRKTYGVVLFQEQVIEIATVIAGFTPGEADRLRRVMTHARSREEMIEIGRMFIRKAEEQGVPPETADTIFSYITGYASYGFCEAHAAAFATTAYKTAYLVEHYPAEFYAAVLSQQPMGYYSPNTIIGEARRRGIKILPLDINVSERDFVVEEVDGGVVGAGAAAAGAADAGAAAAGTGAGAASTAAPRRRQGIRISLRQLHGLKEAAVDAILTARAAGGPFRSFRDFCRRCRIPRDNIENLVLAGAFDSVEPNRRQLLWQLDAVLRQVQAEDARVAARTSGRAVIALAPEWEEALAADALAAEAPADIVDFTPEERFWQEVRLLGIMVRGHVMAAWRRRLQGTGTLSSREAHRRPHGAFVKVAGMPVRPHRPPTKSGRVVVFLSLEDETGLTEVTIFEDVYQQYGQHIFTSPAPPLVVSGFVERNGNGMYVLARKVEPLGEG